MKARMCTWVDVEQLQEKYGIEVWHAGRWIKACDGADPMIYDTKVECLTKVKALKHREIPTDQQRSS